MSEQVEHEMEQQRFVLRVDRQECELTYARQGSRVAFLHTGVPPGLQHRGLANRLAEAALDWARAEGLKVEPRCRFMAVYIQRHRGYHDLLAEPEAHQAAPSAG